MGISNLQISSSPKQHLLILIHTSVQKKRVFLFVSECCGTLHVRRSGDKIHLLFREGLLSSTSQLHNFSLCIDHLIIDAYG